MEKNVIDPIFTSIPTRVPLCPWPLLQLFAMGSSGLFDPNIALLILIYQSVVVLKQFLVGVCYMKAWRDTHFVDTFCFLFRLFEMFLQLIIWLKTNVWRDTWVQLGFLLFMVLLDMLEGCRNYLILLLLSRQWVAQLKLVSPTFIIKYSNQWLNIDQRHLTDTTFNFQLLCICQVLLQLSHFLFDLLEKMYFYCVCIRKW